MILLGLPFYKHDGDKFTITSEFKYQLEDKSIKTIKLSKEPYENRAYWTAFISDDKPTVRAWGGFGNQTVYVVDFVVERLLDKTSAGRDYSYDLLKVITDVPTTNIKASKNDASPPPWLKAVSPENMATSYENLAFAKTIYLNKLDQYKHVLLSEEEKALWL